MEEGREGMFVECGDGYERDTHIRICLGQARRDGVSLFCCGLLFIFL